MTTGGAGTWLLNRSPMERTSGCTRLRLDEKTSRRAREELADSLADRPADGVRQPGAGRPPTEKDLTIIATLEDLVEPETAGAP